MPVVIDVGTNNPKLKSDPRYLGDRSDRLEGDEYYSLIDEFMAAIKLRWPRALVQFEDFQSKHAVKLLARYKREYLMFNDDIQGTAATVLAGLYGAMKPHLSFSHLSMCFALHSHSDSPAQQALSTH